MFPHPKTLKIETIKINGNCPSYRVGDHFFIKGGYITNSQILICLHGLQGLIPYYITLSRGISPYDLGFSHKNADLSTNLAYLRCQDPELTTGGSSVSFRISIMD